MDMLEDKISYLEADTIEVQAPLIGLRCTLGMKAG